MENRKTAADLFKALQKNIKNVVDFTDTMSQITAHLYVMNDDLHSTEEVQNKIFHAAQRSGSGYLAMSEAVAKMGLAAPGMFHSNDEIIALNEQLNKQLAISGVTSEGAAAVISQITDAFSSGVLEANQLSYLLEQAPLVVQTIADYMNKPIEKLRELAQEGQITGRVIKEALLSASDSTNVKFEMLPRTFEQIWSGIQNQVIAIFWPILEEIETITRSNIFNHLTENLVTGVAIFVEIISNMVNQVVNIGRAIYDNWSTVAPVIMGIVTALSLYTTALLFYNIVNGISTAKISVMNAYMALEAGTTFVATAAQYGFNAALLACPITWIILGIIAIVASLYTVIEVINKVTSSNLSAMGIICGTVLTAGSFIGNLFIGLFNGAVDIIGAIWEAISAFVNFFANVFNNPVEAIARLFFDLVNTILSLLKSLASAIDAIFGSKLASSVQNWKDKLRSVANDILGKREQPIEIFDTSSAHLERIQYHDAWNMGNNLGKGFDDKIKSFSLQSILEGGQGNKAEYFNEVLKERQENKPDIFDYQNRCLQTLPDNQYLDATTAETLGSIAADTSSIKDSVTVTSEEIAYLREIAEKEAVNRFTTAEIKVNMNNTNTISSNMDVDGITGRLKEGMYKAMATAREGV